MRCKKKLSFCTKFWSNQTDQFDIPCRVIIQINLKLIKLIKLQVKTNYRQAQQAPHSYETFIHRLACSERSDVRNSFTIREQHRADYVATRHANRYRVRFSFLCSRSPRSLCRTLVG